VKFIQKIKKTDFVQRTAVLAVAFVVVASVAMYGIESKQQSSAAVSGWSSGACCSGVPNGAFATWRGEAVPIAATWMDSKEAAAALWNMDGEYGGWSGDLDVAIGAIFAGESWGSAASGAYDARWRAQVRLMKAKWGNKKTLYIRFAHEMNGTWYPWSVNSGNAANFRAAWARYHRIVQEELVSQGKSAKMVLNFNKDPVNSATAEQIYPGDAYVDVIGVDFYDMYPNYPNQAAWDSHYMAMKNGSPHGIGAWKAFAASKGKPLSFSEWGIHMGNSFDNPFYIEKMHQFFQANAGTGAGQVLYETYFNTWDTIQIYPTTRAPNAAAKYRSLTWGGSGGSITPTPPTPPPPATPGQISQTGNLVSGKTFTSSAPDHPTEAGNPVSNVNDKNESTRWVSAPQDNATVSTDLGAGYTLNKVSVMWAADTVRNYDLQVSSDNNSWTTIASGMTNNTQKQLIDTTSFSGNATGRYFRILAKDRWNASWGNSIWEVGVYGTPAASSGDITPPNVSLTSPVSGTTVQVGSPVTISANATDNVGVSRVDFYADNILLGTDTSSPYGLNWTAAIGTAPNRGLVAKAFDAVGNTGSSQIVMLNVTQQSTPSGGDVNGDGRVNALDLSALISHDGENYAPADFNGDGSVGAADMAILLSRWTW
jgi:hypothetical protein